MNLTEIFTPQTRAKVYMAVGIAGLVIGAAGAGIGAFAAAGVSVPLIVGAVLSALNAIYGFVAGAFGFLAKANTPEDSASVYEQVANTHDLAELIQNYANGTDEPLPYDVEEESEDDSEPVG